MPGSVYIILFEPRENYVFIESIVANAKLSWKQHVTKYEAIMEVVMPLLENSFLVTGLTNNLKARFAQYTRADNFKLTTNLIPVISNYSSQKKLTEDKRILARTSSDRITASTKK